MSAGDVGMTASFLPFCSCWLSLEGGLLYAFVGPAAVIVLVRAPVSVQGGRWPQGSSFPSAFSLTFSSHLGVSLPRGHLVILSSPARLHPGPQVNMLIGIIVFNKLMARDGVSDKSKKQRAG